MTFQLGGVIGDGVEDVAFQVRLKEDCTDSHSAGADLEMERTRVVGRPKGWF